MMLPDLRLLLVRHGQAEANRPWTFLGRTDSPLSAQGRQDAAALAASLAAEKVDVIYTSPLKRAWETAVALAASQQLPLTRDVRLVEQDFGAWEGLALDDVRAQYPDDVAAWQANAAQHGPTGGENLTQVVLRITSFYNEIRQVHQGRTVLLVAHGGLLNACLCSLLQTPLSWLWAYRLEVGSVSEIWMYGEQAVLLRLNG